MDNSNDERSRHLINALRFSRPFQFKKSHFLRGQLRSTSRPKRPIPVNISLYGKMAEWPKARPC